ncbi:DM13 domain-containing protein [Jannaschia sp. CCS1]|uniref:DM13 domain-containing protein n=1 Tax=Jannaschia sp. (strain CCS1) TaxID=290400 RepID=UPI000053B029|nr:DM13 domain-containing protein [Jannaschia sp. CCS1]ABD56993.1 putative secreted protein [Jannaschia sp. CCS1]
MRFLPTLALCMGLAGLGGITPPAEAQTTATAIASGQFQDTGPRYQGSGSAVIAQTSDGQTVLQFGDFSVTPGPDLEVWLVEADAPTSAAAVLASSYISLGPLQSATGGQTYGIPSDIDASAYGSVVIWCEDFSVLFSVAPLR